MKKLVSCSVFLVAMLLAPATAFGRNDFFHRAAPYTYEPRFERNSLSTVKVNLMGGSAKSSFGTNKKKTDLLNLFGNQKFGALATGSIGNPASSLYNADLYALFTSPAGTDTNAAQASFGGKFTFFEADIYLAQNLAYGFFVDALIPVKTLNVTDITTTDASTGINSLAVQWLTVKSEISNIAALYNVNTGDAKFSGVGDIIVSGGWTINNDDLESADFFDATVKVGVSIPSAQKKNEDYAFALALGHDGHIGIPVTFDAAIGFLDWVTLGAHVGGTFFVDKTKNMRLQTSTAQQGFIKLQKGNAKRNMGNIFDVGGFAKADHVFKGFSVAVGYTYTRKDKDVLTPEDTTNFSIAAANADTTLKCWKAHTIHASAEYDFSQEGQQFNPVIGVFYSRPLGGKSVFRTNTYGGNVGLDIAWDF